MEKNYKIIKLGYENVRVGFEGIMLADLKLDHMMISLPLVYMADLIVYISPCREVKILKNRHGAIGIVNSLPIEEENR